MAKNYKKTITACFIGAIIQATIINFAPLLFITFQNEFNIELSKITLLVTINFSLQLLTDFAAGMFVDKLGYKNSCVLAHAFSAIGLICLAILPDLTPDPYVGLMIATCIGAIGGGLLEVIISPTIEACPTKHKERTMSLLHSFYCWGFVLTVIISTVFFSVFGTANWRIMAGVWAVLPIANGILFAFSPFASLHEEGEKGDTILQLFKNKAFWVMALLLVCAGACEQAVGQWASTFAEKLGLSKTLGDLLGPMTFAFTMGISRFVFGRVGAKHNLNAFMLVSAVLCIIAYLITALSPWNIFAVIGCALCGLSVGVLWPAAYSKAAASIKNGGTKMFALLALAGDLGCIVGPTLVGFVSDKFDADLSKGILVALIFPVVLTICMTIIAIADRKKNKNLNLKVE